MISANRSVQGYKTRNDLRNFAFELLKIPIYAKTRAINSAERRRKNRQHNDLRGLGKAPPHGGIAPERRSCGKLEALKDDF